MKTSALVFSKNRQGLYISIDGCDIPGGTLSVDERQGRPASEGVSERCVSAEVHGGAGREGEEKEEEERGAHSIRVSGVSGVADTIIHCIGIDQWMDGSIRP